MRMISRLAELWQRREVMPLMLLVMIFLLTLMLISPSEKDGASTRRQTADEPAAIQPCPCPKP